MSALAPRRGDIIPGLMLSRLAVLAVAVLAAPACKRVPELLLRDSEARVFRADCDAQGTCQLEQRSGEKWPGPVTTPVLRSSGHVVGVCASAGDGEGPPEDCRPLVCAKDSDCPPSHRRTHGTCLNGLCTDESLGIGMADAVMLCMVGTGLGHDSLSQVERRAMAQQCGTPCEVPKPCRQP